ncbi:hypothetical protein Q3A66_02825 [Hymenobacter sp. BT770]|uniref:hypothetical protein n=1 Tax=Hymenobacter sp. BT770 TaxID=2886942 RepID=UPI001D105722|nr:hypothetical protein [Hymenobacter sp. BT770]MCC3152172.1 hypothetical protein [Hymenobacter sp. BT770]MDO3413986.1 hypothetical protein [Hymenobacter sp. BT770]
MPLTIHIAVMLAFWYGYTKLAREPFDRLMAQPKQLKGWVWLYLKGLLLLVILPFVVAESLCMVFLTNWDYNRTMVLAPHFLNLLVYKRFAQFIRATLRS